MAASDQILVRQGSSSGSEISTWRSTPCPTPTSDTEDVATSDSEDLATEDVWYDCDEDFEQHAQEDSAVGAADVLQQAYAALPEQLATIVQSYEQVC